MKITLFTTTVLLTATISLPGAVVINEYWADDASTDTAEYVELFGTPGMSLSGLSFIIVDGDTSGNTGSTNYRRVTQQIDFSAEVIPADGFFVLGAGTTPNVDIARPLNWLQNGSQTYALVNTADIAFDAADTDELTQASIDAITANLTDAIGTVDGGAGDHTYFGAPVIGPNGAGFNWDTASRFPNGVDTDSAGDWATQDNFPNNTELGDASDALSTPGTKNVPEPSVALLGGLAILFGLRRRR
ncbi:MAG: PEP-CTERM sorting domain-containing protein [Akkermansiaceae bacterium]|nr:PEP-CTERM sorting domain-containing protein [Akkermansiaceae bacterium]NNM29286.1 PEP-CTERM sorting domain-containing protein [Akkermansiaceae bacterium]